MTKKTINIGTGEAVGDGESLRSAFKKINDNFDEVYDGMGGIVVPTNISAFVNDVGYIKTINLPTALSQLTNDVGYITTSSLPTTVSQLTNDVGYITSSSLVWNLITGKPTFATVSTSGSYNDLTNKPVIPESTSSLINGAYSISLNPAGGLVFVNGSIQYIAWTGVVSASNVTGLATVSTTGSYLSLINRPRKRINFVIDGNGSELTPGVKGYVVTDVTGNIDQWTILADTTGSVVVDVKKSTYSDFPATTSITSSDKPTISDSRKNRNSTLTVWTTSVVAGDILEFVVDSASTVTQVVVNLRINEV